MGLERRDRASSGPVASRRCDRPENNHGGPAIDPLSRRGARICLVPSKPRRPMASHSCRSSWQVACNEWDRRRARTPPRFEETAVFSEPLLAEKSAESRWRWAYTLLLSDKALSVSLVTVGEGARLENALAVCDGVLRISRPLRSQPINGDRVYSIDPCNPR